MSRFPPNRGTPSPNPSSNAPHYGDPFSEADASHQNAYRSSPSQDDGGLSAYGAHHGNQESRSQHQPRYQLSDSYGGSMGMSSHSFEDPLGDKDHEGEETGGLDEEDEEIPLKSAFGNSSYGPQGQGQGQQFASGGFSGHTTPSLGPPGSLYSDERYASPALGYHRAGSTGLARTETSAEAWGRRQRINPRRALTKKVKLTKQGNFINEYRVPTAVKSANMSSGVIGGPTEFSHMRYTAACCDPNDFTDENGYTLRASSYGRQTDLLVCITAYNENKMLLSRTLHGMMLNIRDMVKGKFSEFRRMAEAGGPEGGRTGEAWKRIVVCLVFDGIAPADKAALDVLATIGLYQDGVMKKDVDGKETVAHIFEYTTQLSMSPKPALVEPHPNDPNNLVPVQMILCIKQKNAKKINSHRWLFNAFGKHLQPDVVCLLDAGTKPEQRSIYYMWEAFHHNKHLGGACGEIKVMLGKYGRKLFNPLVAAQNFEYKISNILDKPTESSFGFISVLPGAFSCYRFAALQGRPLAQYFHGDQTMASRLGAKGTDGMGIWTKNMFLAEDRILCSELVMKANERWILGYIKLAKGETDVPETAAELISQRRRWLNGSFAAGVYSLAHFARLYKSNHGIVRLFFLHVQAIYNTVTLIMTVANYYLTFYIIITVVTDSLRSPNAIAGADPATMKCWSGSFLQDDSGTSVNWLSDFNWALAALYVAFLALQVILALGNRPKAEKLTYTISICAFASFSIYLIFMTVILTVKAFCPLSSILATNTGSTFGVFFGGTYGVIFAGIAGTFGIYIIASLLYLDPMHLLHSMPQFLLITASFTNILNVYAFCNLHDVSWGTKGSDTVELPSATSTKDGKQAVVEVHEKVQEDIDSTFKATVLRAMTPFKEVAESSKSSPDDQNKTFRTRFICVWLAMNAALALTIVKLGTNVHTTYFQTLLWINFGLAFVRFCGLIWYLVGESIFRLARLCGRRR